MTEEIKITDAMKHEADMKAREANEMVKLKNGSEELSCLVKTTMMALRNLWDSVPIAIYELAMVCRDPKHTPFGKTGDDLKSWH